MSGSEKKRKRLTAQINPIMLKISHQNINPISVTRVLQTSNFLIFYHLSSSPLVCFSLLFSLLFWNEYFFESYMYQDNGVKYPCSWIAKIGCSHIIYAEKFTGRLLFRFSFVKSPSTNLLTELLTSDSIFQFFFLIILAD